jgi:hypothetical protein
MSCAHELILLNRKTLRTECYDCKVVLTEPVASALPLPRSPALAPAATPSTGPCTHMLVQANPVTNIVTCQLCSEVLTRDTYTDTKGVTRAAASDSAGVFAMPKYLQDTQFRATEMASHFGASYQEAYAGEENDEGWTPFSGAPCPHPLKTAHPRTGALTCSVCKADLSDE